MSITIDRYQLSQVEFWFQYGQRPGEWIAFAWFNNTTDAQAFIEQIQRSSESITYRIVELEEE
jgi:hypothetical protein